MRRFLPAAVAAMLSLTVFLFFGSALVSYVRPVREAVYDLSLMWEGEAMPEDWTYDQKGWTVFAQTGERRSELMADGLGGFYGDIEPGQPFYFSRRLTETLNSPTLRLSAFDGVAVFLDDELFYSDAAVQEARIGYVALPESGWRRSEPIALALPEDYWGKVLTIAQSAGVSGMDVPRERFTVYPCAVTIYDGYAYENGLISESFRTAIPAALLFVAGVLFLAAFVAEVYRKRWNGLFLCAALSMWLWMLGLLADTSFFHAYRGKTAVDVAFLCRCFSLSALLAFLSCRAGRFRRVLGTVTALNMGASVLCLMMALLGGEYPNDVNLFLRNVPFQFTGLTALLIVLLGAWFFWHRENRFYGLFAPLTALGMTAGLIDALLVHGETVRQQLKLALASQLPAYFLWPLMRLVVLATIVSGVAEMAEAEVNRRIEARRLLERNAMAMASYENLCLQHRQVMMIRHDMAKHLSMLRQLTHEAPVAVYLDELIGQNKKIPTILQSGNQMVDMIFNSRLAGAEAAGVDVQVLSAHAPRSLPLSDADLCSLMMNLADNAIAAACSPALIRPWIRLDLRLKDNFFVFTCENAAVEAPDVKPGDAGRGLGLKIVRNIVERYECLMEAEREKGSYKVTVAIPLR